MSEYDSSGTILSGGNAQELFPVNLSRRGWSVQNLSSGDLYVRDTGTASAGAGSYRIKPGELYETPDGMAQHKVQLAVSIFGATTGQVFTAQEW